MLLPPEVRELLDAFPPVREITVESFLSNMGEEWWHVEYVIHDQILFLAILRPTWYDLVLDKLFPRRKNITGINEFYVHMPDSKQMSMVATRGRKIDMFRGAMKMRLPAPVLRVLVDGLGEDDFTIEEAKPHMAILVVVDMMRAQAGLPLLLARPFLDLQL